MKPINKDHAILVFYSMPIRRAVFFGVAENRFRLISLQKIDGLPSFLNNDDAGAAMKQAPISLFGIGLDEPAFAVRIGLNEPDPSRLTVKIRGGNS